MSNTSGMYRRLTGAVLGLGLCLGLVLAQDKKKILTDPAGLFQDLDKNDDGKLTANELPPPIRDRLKNLDTNKDGAIGPAEYLVVVKRARDGYEAAQKALQDKLPKGTRVLLDLEYVPNGHERQKLDLFIPQAGTAPRPLVIWIHGGGWKAGDKSRNVALPLLKAGFAVAAINYRYSTQAIFPAQIEDCRSAVRYLREHAGEYQLDPGRFGAWGASAGGHLTALLATQVDEQESRTGSTSSPSTSARVQAAVDWFGPTDFEAYAKGVGLPRKKTNTEGAAMLSQLFGGPPSPKNFELIRQASPVNFVSADDPPILIMQGDQDPLVPVQQSEALHKALKKEGVDSTLQIIKGAGHGFTGDEAQKTVAAFFVKHLKP